MSNIINEFLEFIEYLEANGCTLDENGNIVKKESQLTLEKKQNEK